MLLFELEPELLFSFCRLMLAFVLRFSWLNDAFVVLFCAFCALSSEEFPSKGAEIAGEFRKGIGGDGSRGVMSKELRLDMAELTFSGYFTLTEAIRNIFRLINLVCIKKGGICWYPSKNMIFEPSKNFLNTC